MRRWTKPQYSPRHHSTDAIHMQNHAAVGGSTWCAGGDTDAINAEPGRSTRVNVSGRKSHQGDRARCAHTCRHKRSATRRARCHPRRHNNAASTRAYTPSNTPSNRIDAQLKRESVTRTTRRGRTKQHVTHRNAATCTARDAARTHTRSERRGMRVDSTVDGDSA